MENEPKEILSSKLQGIRNKVDGEVDRYSTDFRNSGAIARLLRRTKPQRDLREFRRMQVQSASNELDRNEALESVTDIKVEDL